MKKIATTLLATCIACVGWAGTQKTNDKKPATQKAEFVIVQSGEYRAGQEDPRLTAGISQFLGMEPSVTKITQLEALQNSSLANMDFSFLPVYLIKKTDAVQDKMAEYIKRGYVQETEEYIVLARQTRTGVYTNKEGTANQMEIFVMSQCPYGVMAENAVIEAKEKGIFPKDEVVRELLTKS